MTRARSFASEHAEAFQKNSAAKYKRVARYCEVVFHSNAFKSFTLILTLYALVGDDTRTLAFDKSADPVFDALTIFCIVTFTIEMYWSCSFLEDYLFGFWFWADLFATLSLVLDLAFVTEGMAGPVELGVNGRSGGQGISFSQSEYARAGRSSRVGARVARIIRVVRFIRLGNIATFFHTVGSTVRSRCSRGGESSPGTSEHPLLGGGGGGGGGGAVSPSRGGDGGISGPGSEASFLESYDAVHEEKQEESRVGRELSERTTQRVIYLTLAMLFVVPLLQVGDYPGMMAASGQLGAEVVFVSWRNYELAVTSGAPQQLQVQRRMQWEKELLLFIVSHAYAPSADNYLHKLCWVGYVPKRTTSVAPDALDFAQEAYIQVLLGGSSTAPGPGQNASSIDARFNSIPSSVAGALARPWSTDCGEGRSQMLGVSLVPGVVCPQQAWRRLESTWFVPTFYSDAYWSNLSQGIFVFAFDTRSEYRSASVMGMLQMVMVVLVLATAALSISREVDLLVLNPIERMIAKVEIIRQDPLYAIRWGQEEAEQENVWKRKAARSSSNVGGRKGAEERAIKAATMETKILENAIIKLGSLLALGFGEAGVEIIGSNLDSDNAMVNAMIPGIKVEGIYGFCNLRHFASITEVLKENTMVFVNQVAEIVHGIVHLHWGCPNRNAGGGFFLVWHIGRFPHEMRSKIADLAAMSFVKAVAGVTRCQKLVKYREHPALVARLRGFSVGLGFGLHLGWSIEGAIGSEFKIDASYLSPHVNVASKLEAATAELGVSLLVSEPLAAACSMRFSSFFRAVDSVRFQGSTVPTRLFTVDMCHQVLTVEARRDPLLSIRSQSNLPVERRDRRIARAEMLESSYQPSEEFDTDEQVCKMRDPYTLHFLQEFEKGYLNYEAGEWDVAQQVFKKTVSMLKMKSRKRGAVIEDGPSACLLRFMERSDFQAPAKWPGYRVLNI